MKIFSQKSIIKKHPLDEQLEAGLRGDFKRGWELAQLLEKKSPLCHRAAFNRAWYHMMQGDLLKGLECLDRGRWENVFGDQPLPTSKPIWRNENLQNKYVLLCSEGGLGDEIINVRFASDFAKLGAKVIVSCDPSLASVFSRVAGVSAVLGCMRAPEVYHDFWVPAMSAAHVLGYQFKDLSGDSYLTPDSNYIIKWRKILSEKYGENCIPKIGLRFYGNQKFEHEQFRKFPKDKLIDCVGSSTWINLQKEETDLPIENWEDTLAIISQLDLVITSCTSVAHAAAAMGKSTWVLVPILPYYIWALPGKKSPWYQSVTLFRQKKVGDWSETFLEVKNALSYCL